MKNLLFATAFAVASIAIVSCNNNKTANTSTSADSTSTESVSNDNETTTTKAGVDSKTASSINGLLAKYLEIKNGLSNDNGDQAGKASKTFVSDFENVDHTAMTPKQMKTYTEIADDAKEMAQHIADNPDKLEHQREHFDMLSKDMVDLVKLFGAGQTVYVDHCPMYNDKKGAIWLSESKEIKNPYMGSKMVTCGMIKEELN